MLYRVRRRLSCSVWSHTNLRRHCQEIRGKLGKRQSPGAGAMKTTPGGDAMHEDCCGVHELPRRQVLQGGLAAAAVGALGASAAATAPGAARAASDSEGVRAIDIHAHYFPQGYRDLMEESGKQHGF